MLDKRAQILLKTLIERYIAEGEPIGSRTLSKYSGLDLSPATIRNVMSDLEEMGLISSPHTSAGRIPTPLGYRFFVDTLLVIKQIESGELRSLEGQLHPDNPQRLIQNASQLLSQLTQFAGVVMTPANCVSCESSCEAFWISRCGLSGWSCPSRLRSSPDSICLITSSVSTKKR